MPMEVKMKKKILLVIITFVLLTGCGNTGQQNKQSSLSNKTASEILNSSSPANYNQYIKKAWIKKNGSNNTSFYISNIANGKISGHIVTIGSAEPTIYGFQENLTGTINKNTAECQFSDSFGNKGTVTLVFRENNVIEATIKLINKANDINEQPQEGTFDFIPYSLSNLSGFSLINNQSFMVNLNSWGNVKFVSGKLTSGKHISVVFYLTNQEGDILFDFEPSLPYNVDIQAVSFIDLNKNGLKDIIIIVKDKAAIQSQLATVYFQNTNGLFTNNTTLDEKINNSGNNKNVKNVENYVYQNLNNSESSNSKVSSDIENSNAISAYKSVLENKAQFFSTDNKKNRYLNDFLANNGGYGTSLTVSNFTVLDMDGDGIPDVVLELSVGTDNPQFYEVLHYMNGEVYGYLQVYRGLESLKVDGTSVGSSGAYDNECGKLIFNTTGCDTNVLGYMKSNQSKSGITISYFINNKPVTKDEFNVFENEQNAKKDVTWNEFSQDNIENLENLVSK
jgi:hypothetical protein